VLLIATAAFYLFESPFLKLKRYFGNNKKTAAPATGAEPAMAMASRGSLSVPLAAGRPTPDGDLGRSTSPRPPRNKVNRRS